MDATAFFGLQRRANAPTVWDVPVTAEICSAQGTLYGGTALGIGVEVLERTAERAALWATAQFYDFARPGDALRVEAELVVVGNHNTQGRVRAWVDDREIFMVVGSLGRRENRHDRAWPEPPAVTPRADCERRDVPEWAEDTVFNRFEVLLPPPLAATQWRYLIKDGKLTAPDADVEGVKEAQRTGRTAMWVRVPELEPSAAALGLIADLVSWGLTPAVGEPVAGQSLDNSLRIGDIASTEWYLIDIQALRVAQGTGYSIGHIWSEQGVLLGTASQSEVARPMLGELPRPARLAAEGLRSGGHD